MTRDYGKELDALQAQFAELRDMVAQLARQAPASAASADYQQEAPALHRAEGQEAGSIFFTGSFHCKGQHYRWEPQEKAADQLLQLDSDKIAKILSALGHKQRIDILRAVLQEPLTGAELVERLNMGTTGQLYHHIKALQGADLLTQEERGGAYTLPGHRALPFLLLLAAAGELLDTSDYMELAKVRTQAGDYLGDASSAYDPHQLLRAVLENAMLEHQAGCCTQVSIILHGDGSVTVADNGRGIPTHAFANSDKPRVQAVLTELSRDWSASVYAPNSAKGISIPVVNALSQTLTVEVRREGKAFRQTYKHGIPQTPLLTVGLTNETGMSLTFLPDRDIFARAFEQGRVADSVASVAAACPELHIEILTD